MEGETIQYLAIGEVTPHRRLANLQLKVGNILTKGEEPISERSNPSSAPRHYSFYHNMTEFVNTLLIGIANEMTFDHHAS